jgi:tetratricopeptide (TPR) repeat protein
MSAETPENEIFIEQISEGELPTLEGIELDTQQVPKFESVGDAIDWLEEITASQESQDEQALMEELSEEIKSASVSPPLSGWILESTAPKMEISSGTEGDSSLSKQININKAKLIELENLPGLGFRTAQNILNYRQTHGNITSFDELQRALRDEHAFIMARKSIRFDEEYQNEEPPSLPELKALLVQAQNAVDQEQFDVALENYQYMIQFNSMLNEVMDGLKQAVELNPHSSHLWQTLGDVYLRSDHLQEALDAFNKAESLLK